MKDDERFTQAALDRLTPIEPSAHLRRMVAQIPLEHPRNVHSLWPFESRFLPSLSMAAVALFGLFVGRGLASVVSFPSAATQAIAPAQEVMRGSDDSFQESPSTDWEAGALGMLDDDADELDELLILATAGDFSADDWDLSQNPRADETDEGTF